MFKNVQTAVDESRQMYENPYWSPLAILAGITEEVGELARLLNHLYGDKPKKLEESKQHLGEEIADVMYGCICLANSQDIDLDVEFKKALNKAQIRDKDRFVRKV